MEELEKIQLGPRLDGSRQGTLDGVCHKRGRGFYDKRLRSNFIYRKVYKVSNECMKLDENAPSLCSMLTAAQCSGYLGVF